MKRRLAAVAGAVVLAALYAPSAFANPASAPGAGDTTDVANVTTIAAFSDGSDVPGPNGEGVNNSPNFSPTHASFHSVTNNPACLGHDGGHT